MNTALALQFQAQLAVDQQNGMQSAAIIWCAPPIYRDPACLGAPEGAIESAPENYSTSYQLYQDVLSAKKIQTQVSQSHYLEAVTVLSWVLEHRSRCRCLQRMLSDWLLKGPSAEGSPRLLSEPQTVIDQL